MGRKIRQTLPIFSDSIRSPTEAHIGWDPCLRPGTPLHPILRKVEDWNTKRAYDELSQKKIPELKKQVDNSGYSIDPSVTD